jgi:hypothetical protein
MDLAARIVDLRQAELARRRNERLIATRGLPRYSPSRAAGWRDGQARAGEGGALWRPKLHGPWHGSHGGRRCGLASVSARATDDRLARHVLREEPMVMSNAEARPMVEAQGRHQEKGWAWPTTAGVIAGGEGPAAAPLGQLPRQAARRGRGTLELHAGWLAPPSFGADRAECPIRKAWKDRRSVSCGCPGGEHQVRPYSSYGASFVPWAPAIFTHP